MTDPPPLHRLASRPPPQSLLRSQSMSLIQVYMPSDLHRTTMHALGALGVCGEMQDQHPPQTGAFERPFYAEWRRVDAWQRVVAWLAGECGWEMSHTPHAPHAPHTPRSLHQLHELGALIDTTEARVRGMTSSLQLLREQVEHHALLVQVLAASDGAFLMHQAAAAAADDEQHAPTADTDSVETGHSGRPLLARTPQPASSFLTGVLPRTQRRAFGAILRRAFRGNVYHQYVEDEEEEDDDDQHQHWVPFMVYAHGQVVLAKCQRIADALGARVFAVPPAQTERRQLRDHAERQLADLRVVAQQSERELAHVLQAVRRQLPQWHHILHREMRVCAQLNQCLVVEQPSGRAVVGECWLPTASINVVQYALHAMGERAGGQVAPVMSVIRDGDAPSTLPPPPTYHRLNKFTRAFQAIVDAYGIASYKEVNPALFTCITFPFLFAVMFGDMGHGAMVVAVGAWMCWYERWLADWLEKHGGASQNEMLATVYGGRYIILLMGVFSVWAGVIYNDLFSLPVYFAPSGWGMTQTVNGTESTFLHTYPIGIDPAWRLAENGLLFLNSYKMKMSILLGVVHMSCGILLTAVNARYFCRDPQHPRGRHVMVGETLPMLVFMWSIFGYLCFLIVYKWAYPWDVPKNDPPGLLNTLIFMFLKPGRLEAGQLYTGQAVVQVVLLLLVMVCVPWMLCVKPYLVWKDQRRERGYALAGGESPSTRSHASDVADAPHGDSAHDAHSMTDMIVHQIIHTIEFCLGAISNTASYLRLWALSLAHSQLSEVLWEMTIHSTLSSPFMLVVGYFMWFSLTIAILILMEGLSAFLHALRLHWVEFNNKFYEGGGKEWVVFKFE